MNTSKCLRSVAAAAVLVGGLVIGSDAKALFIDFAKIAQDAKSTLGTEYLWGNLKTNTALDMNGETVAVGSGAFRNVSGTVYYQQDGIRVLVTGNGTLSGTDAYLDGLSGGPGGVGACNSNNCGGIDNIALAAGEDVTIMFFDTGGNAIDVLLVSSEHTDADHKLVNIGNFDLKVDAGAATGFTPSVGTTVGGYGGNRKQVSINQSGHSFSFDATSKELYVSGLTVSVPEPATLGLLGVGLAGLGFAARRRRKAA